ncbi:competence/damage-inducible protein A [Pseudohoeflea coraliihabitans]|uniref:Competence/damage-inducible protein A n=1 Tax=Pseudohoeflea coraliihabitans TaxID=2860393 RepID=A0ABS6WS90_9HYPH|nr:competence/damage-inducible protein A [Pseudohoeflea sp. DP4N28-3]MBW3098821.1 competence/damage-inducible protein A [Pseudohoeflea sp. DP4N28-3]
MPEPDRVTAAALAIGDELLSGRTKDRNIGHLAELLTLRGIDLCEARIVADTQSAIVAALNALRASHDYVFTSGGIGPTHDDITADAVAAAFGVPCQHDAEAMQRLGEHYARRGVEFTSARQRMARMPLGARLIDNPVSVAPGFVIGNVFVMAGVPQVFSAMLDNVLPELEGGRPLISRTYPCPLAEGDIGAALADLSKAHAAVSIGSYPRLTDTGYANEIIVRGREAAAVEAAGTAVAALIERLRRQDDAAAAVRGDKRGAPGAD